MSESIIPANSPLMQPVWYNNKECLSSQRIHRDYMLDMARHPELKVKHQRHDNFLQAIRNIEIYPEYKHSEDIYEVTWNEVKSSKRVTKEELKQWKLVFLESGWNRLTYFSAIAQQALIPYIEKRNNKKVLYDERAMYAIFKKNPQRYIPGARITDRFIINNKRPDFFLLLNRELSVAEFKARKFKNRDLYQLLDYVQEYKTNRGFAVAPLLGCELPSNITFVRWWSSFNA